MSAGDVETTSAEAPPLTQLGLALLTLVGGFAAGVATDRIKRKWDRDEQARKLIGQYRDPLLRAAFNLQSRLYNILVWDFLALSRSGERASKAYAVETTAWHFAHYLGWVEILRHEVQFLDLGTARRNKQLQARLGAVAHALASDREGYRPAPPHPEKGKATAKPVSRRGAAGEPAFMVYRTDQQAIGEAMFKERPQPGDATRVDCLSYTEFIAKLAANDGQSGDPLPRWFGRFSRDLEALARGGWSQRHPRLIAIRTA